MENYFRMEVRRIFTFEDFIVDFIVICGNEDFDTADLLDMMFPEKSSSSDSDESKSQTDSENDVADSGTNVNGKL